MATVYYPTCPDEDLAEYQCDPCANREKGKVRSAAYIHTSYLATVQANPTSTAVWQTGIANETIIIIPMVIGSLDTPDPITGPGYGDDDEEILGRQFTLAFRDPNYIQNCNFYNGLKRKKGQYYVAYRTETQTHISTKTVSVDTRAPITETITDNVEWNVTNRWTDEDQPCPFDTPEEIFTCFGLLP